MKKLFILLFPLLIAGFTSCEENIDTAKEKENIKETIVGFFKDRSDLNFEDYLNTWSADPSTFMSYAGKNGYAFMNYEQLKNKGQEDFADLKQTEIDNGYKISMEPLDITIKVYEETAWAHCKNKWTKVFTESDETEDMGETFLIFSLVKTEEGWKIDFVSAIVSNSYNEVTVEELD